MDQKDASPTESVDGRPSDSGGERVGEPTHARVRYFRASASATAARRANPVPYLRRSSAGSAGSLPAQGLRRAVVVAGHKRDSTTARANLDNSDPAVRAAALGALERAGDLVPDDLTEAALDPEPTVRRRVAELAALLGTRSPDALDQRAALEDVLLALLADDNDLVAEVAAFALGELSLGTEGATRDLGGPGAFPPGTEAAPRRVAALAEVATDHRDALCREAAVAALGAIGHPLGLSAVLTGCGDRANIRRRAVLALSAFEGEDVTAMLEHLSTDRDLQVSQAAVDLLAIESGHVT